MKVKIILLLLCVFTLNAMGQKNRKAVRSTKTYETSVCGNIDGHNYVDLGLSVMWATCNVGANEISEFGNLYAFASGTTEEYDWENYPYPEYKNYPGDLTLPSEHDTATLVWGKAWRTPTYEEFLELKTRCKWLWVAYGDIMGCKVIGPNGNCIFLPAAGSNAGDFYEPNVHGMYWSSTIMISGPGANVGSNKRLRFRNGLVSLDYSHGPQVSMSVRPVLK